MKAISINSYSERIPHGLMFHRFHGSNQSTHGQGSITEIQLEQLLLHVGIDRILTPQEWIMRVKSNNLQVGDLCLTFDDGLKSQIDVVLPILEKYNLKAFFFIISAVCEGGYDLNEVYSQFASTKFESFDGFIKAFFEYNPIPTEKFVKNGYEPHAQKMRQMFPFYSELDIKYRFARNKLLNRNDFEIIINGMIEAMGLKVEQIVNNLWMNDQELKDLAQNGHYIGLHSYTHPFELNSQSEAEQKTEYQKNYDHLTKVTNQKIEAVAHPLGSYNKKTLSILSEMGIHCGFRSSMTPVNGSGNLEIPREDPVNILRKM